MVVTALTLVFVLNGSYCLAPVFVLNGSYYLGPCVCMVVTALAPVFVW
jgi:hypothetical protein